MHVWYTDSCFAGYIEGFIKGEKVRFTIRHDTDSPDMPTSEKIYSQGGYLGYLDNEETLDYSFANIEEYPYYETY